MEDEDQIKFDFDKLAAESQRVGTFEEFLRLDPRKIRGIKVCMPDLSNLSFTSRTRLLVPQWAIEEFGEDAFKEVATSTETGATVTDESPSASRPPLEHACVERIEVWVPFGDGRLFSGMAVPFNGQQMDRKRYTVLLRNRLEELISKDPQDAKHWMTGSSEHNPNLYTIAIYNPSGDWADQIMMSDQMMIRLNSFDWARGVVESISADEMPSLPELIEQL